MIEFLKSTMDDIDMIFHFYDLAIEFQKTVYDKQWEYFEKSMIESEIKNDLQYKMVEKGEVLAIFALSFNDEQFWKERAKDPSIYIHRIVTHPDHYGKKMTEKIITWAKDFGKNQGKKYIRIDTWGDNKRLLDYYIKCGFRWVDTIELDKLKDVPVHYRGNLALLELPI